MDDFRFFIEKIFPILVVVIALMIIISMPFITYGYITSLRENVNSEISNSEEQLSNAIESEYELYVDGEKADINTVDLKYMANSCSYNVSVDDEKKVVLVTSEQKEWCEVYEIRSIVNSSSTEVTATETTAFTVGYYEYTQNNYYSVYMIEEDGGIKPSKFPEENSIFYEDLESDEEPYVEVCTKSESCFDTQEELYRIHVPENTIYKKIEIKNE